MNTPSCWAFLGPSGPPFWGSLFGTPKKGPWEAQKRAKKGPFLGPPGAPNRPGRFPSRADLDFWGFFGQQNP